MKTLEFSVTIAASPERVWEQLWSDAGYRDWTAAFMEGSYAETDWKEGSPVRFLAPDGSGMYSTIAVNRAPEEMVFVHEGELRNGEPLPPAAWAGARERYRLHPEGGRTRVDVSVDSGEETSGYFAQTFPKALERLRQSVEQQMP